MSIAAADPKPPIPELATPAEKLIAELQRQLELSHNIEESLRKELANEQAGTKRWAARLQALENRAMLIRAIANGRLPDDVIATLLGGL